MVTSYASGRLLAAMVAFAATAAFHGAWLNDLDRRAPGAAVTVRV